MKKQFLVAAVLIFLVFSCASHAAAFGQNSFRKPAVGDAIKEYLPGDFVHIVVEAPLDTVSMSATMPDGIKIYLVRDRKNNIWHGLWQVPLRIKAGSYAAALSASDVEGNEFEGETAPFAVGEISIITLVTKSTAEGATVGRVEKEIQPESKTPQARPSPTPLVMDVKPKAPAKPAKTESKFNENMQLVKVPKQSERSLNLQTLKLISGVRYFIEKTDYAKARSQLLALIKADPGNAEARKMLMRVNALIKLKEK